jgi:hypothetical protein
MLEAGEGWDMAISSLSRLLIPFVLLLAGSIQSTAIPQSVKNEGSAVITPAACVVTLPNGNQPPVKNFGGTVTYSPVSPPPHTDYMPGSHGNGKLWTILPTDGRLLITPQADGSLSEKFPWWRGVRGRLTIQGRRLDAPAPPLKSHVPGGYRESGFQASGATLPSAGCWEITGRVNESRLTFLVEVRTAK